MIAVVTESLPASRGGGSETRTASERALLDHLSKQHRRRNLGGGALGGSVAQRPRRRLQVGFGDASRRLGRATVFPASQHALRNLLDEK